MTDHDHIDERGLAGGAIGGFDDDRLIAYALGLEDDAELRAALAGDGALRDRLATMQAELAQVEGGIRSAVPPTPPAYDDPADARWQALRPYFEHKPATVRRGFYGRRALTYVAALGLVAAVSVGVVETQFRNSATTGRSATAATQDSGKAAGGGTELSGAPVYGAGSPGAVHSPAPANNADEFAVHIVVEAVSWHKVVVARAGDVVAGAQRFAILRVLKGSVKAHSVTLSVGTAPPVAAGTLCVLYLDPTATPAASSAGGSLYLLAGVPALVEPLPTGENAGDPTLP
jgi:hypothetical protein